MWINKIGENYTHLPSGLLK